MAISLAGIWKVQCYREQEVQDALLSEILLPGTINGCGLGDAISEKTEWNSGLHNPFWHEREEYNEGTWGEIRVPFLSQPKSFYSGKARYTRKITVEQEGEYYLFIELSKWKLELFVDGAFIGCEESLCAPFCFGPFHLSCGEHELEILVDNSMQHPYRPDGHGVSDALNANWNGMGGALLLWTAEEYQQEEAKKKRYALEHPRIVTTKDGAIVVDGKPEYMRGTHFGGDFPLSGMPDVEVSYWVKLFRKIKEWGFNFVRCHSFCPPEAAFAAADAEQIYIQVECGMWNIFRPGIPMLKVLEQETKKILQAFGHHPSFVLFSPSNEPGGDWYQVLRDWVGFARNVDKELGYEGRRIYTAQSGWYYDVPPEKIEGTDYIYFHRSAYGPIHGGMIRNHWGWNGKDYRPSVEGSRLPIISHEMGQWCAYPDFDVIKKFTGYALPGNFEIFKKTAEKNDVLQYNKEFAYCSGRTQVRLLKEEFEANFRTPEITGYEYLDLHDYTGQGTALVGVLDALWDNKGYTTPEEFRRFNSPVVILARIESYVLKSTDCFVAPLELCNFGTKEYDKLTLSWSIKEVKSGTILGEGELEKEQVALGKNTEFGTVVFDFGAIDVDEVLTVQNAEAAKFAGITENAGAAKFESRQQIHGMQLQFLVQAFEQNGVKAAENAWDLTLFVKPQEEQKKQPQKTQENQSQKAQENQLQEVQENYGEQQMVAETTKKVLYTKDFEEAMEALQEGRTVLLTPYLSDMDFECPSLSARSVFWNAQMGPNWSRQLGIVVEEKHPLFQTFPTTHSGGWEWQNILEHARGYHFPPKYCNIVRVIDEWNRNYPLSLIFEGKVLNGKLLFAAANLDGDFETRPAAATLREALLSYAASDSFSPEQEILPEDLLKHMRPMYRGSDIIKEVTVNKEKIKESINCYDINPNIPFIYPAEKLPVEFEITLKHPVKVKRLYCLPIQNDREFLGVIRDYRLQAEDTTLTGTWKNGFETCWSEELDVITDRLTLTVLSTYSQGEVSRFEERKDGWYRIKRQNPLVVSMAALGVEYEETEACMSAEAAGAEKLRRNDEHFWRGAAASRYREIDV